VPVGGGVDRDDRLAEPEFRHGREPDHREVGADLHDGVHVVAVELLDRLATHSAGVTCAMPVQERHCSAMSRTTEKPMSPK
jgi:hypothetical protein